MKCENCGFVYDNETLCPICGTPAVTQTEPSAKQMTDNPYSTPSNPASAAVQPAQPPSPLQTPRPEKSKRPKGMMIALLCILSVIAACMVYNTVSQIVTQIVTAEKKQKREKTADRVTELLNKMLDAYEAADAMGLIDNPYNDMLDNDNSWSDDDTLEPEELTDSVTRKVGETYDFGKGAVSLKSIKLTSASPAFDETQQQVAFTVELTNNTKEEQFYSEPLLSIGNTDFDMEHFLFSETDRQTEDFAYQLAPGESLTTVVYYHLPKQNQSMTCDIDIYGGENSEYNANTAFAFEIKDIK